MNISLFAGFITGNLIVFLVVATAVIGRRRKGYVDADERTALINARSGEAAFYGVGLFAYGGWIADNVIAYLQGEPLRFFSPWSAMVAACLLIYVVASASYHFKMTAEDASDENFEERARKPAVVSLFLALVANSLLLTTVQVPEFQVVMLALEMLLIFGLAWTFAPLLSRRSHTR